MKAVPSQHTPVEIVAAFYVALGKGDHPAAVALLDDDIVAIEPPGHPAAGTYRGKAELVPAIPGIMAAMGWRGSEVHQLLASGDVVVALLDVLMTSPDGTQFEMAVAEVWQLRDGKLIRVQPFYYDTHLLAQRFPNQQRLADQPGEPGTP